MKTRLFIFSVSAFLISSLSMSILLTWWSPDHHVLKAAENDPILSNNYTINQRQNITFILGEDKDNGNPYFKHASAYYSQEAKKGIDTVITNLKTLLEVSQYLHQHPTTNGLPWGQIKMVVHSNEWTGLSAPIMEGIKRTTVEGVEKAIQEGHFIPLSEKRIDSQTQLELWGCGLGYNTDLMKTIGKAFGQAKVYSPKHFVQYRKDEWGQMKRYLNRCYYTTFPTGYRPSDGTLTAAFEQRYPSVNLDWKAAINTSPGNAEHQSYNYDFKIPIVWLVSYENKADRPAVKTKIEKNQWIGQQAELQKAFGYYKLDKDAFTWTIYPKMHTFSDGITEPSIKAIGLCTILCVLEPLGDPESGTGMAFLPLDPDLENEEYFACVL